MYAIEMMDSWGCWSDDIGDPRANQFATEEEAWAAIEQLKALGEDWAAGDYRVVEVTR